MLHALIRSGLAMVAVGVLGSCASRPLPLPVPSPTPVPERAVVIPAPQLTRTEGFADHLEVTWRTFRGEHDVVGGYDVYVATSPGLANLPEGDQKLTGSLFGGAPYPGDTDGIIDSESISITPVAIGTRYFVHVRTVLPDGHESPPSAEREVIARPRGSLTLQPRFSGKNDGFSFAGDHEVPCLSDSNDIYLFQGKGGPYLGSPSRLNPLLRNTRFATLGLSASIDDYPIRSQSAATSDKVAVATGHSILIMITDGRFAKMRPRQLYGSGDSLSVTFDYVYQPILGEEQF